MSSYNCFGYWAHFHILENLGASLGRVFSAIWDELLSELCHCYQGPLSTQLGVETQPFQVTFEPKIKGGGRWVGIGNFAGGDFFTGWWDSEEEWFWRFEPFSKLKTAFCKYWTSTEIKISVTFVSKECKTKTKMIQKQWLQLKMTFLLGYNLKMSI